jgi:hypothetical protein
MQKNTRRNRYDLAESSDLLRAFPVLDHHPRTAESLSVTWSLEGVGSWPGAGLHLEADAIERREFSSTHKMG